MPILIKWSEFQTTIAQQIKVGQEIDQNFSKSKTEEQLNDLQNQIKKWVSEVETYLKKSFDSDEKDIVHNFYYPRSSRYNVPSGRTKKEPWQLIKEELEYLREKIETLDNSLTILNVCDSIVRPHEVNLEERKNYETNDILSLIMEKLYDLYNDCYHSIGTILSGNGIEVKGYEELGELGKFLESHGYIRIRHAAQGFPARLTIEGKLKVEEERRATPTDYSQISDSQEELNTKIDELKQHLIKLGLGQKIIFNELDELGNLRSKLDKKNWGQILKGKLVDLGLSQAINKKTMNLIFKELTEQILKIG